MLNAIAVKLSVFSAIDRLRTGASSISVQIKNGEVTWERWCGVISLTRRWIDRSRSYAVWEKANKIAYEQSAMLEGEGKCVPSPSNSC
jgi:hypothetical protein